MNVKYAAIALIVSDRGGCKPGKNAQGITKGNTFQKKAAADLESEAALPTILYQAASGAIAST